MERSGYDPKTYDGTIGILGGANISSYLFSNLYENDPMNVMSHFLTRLGILSGNQSDYMCTRIAYLLDLKGPTMAIQSACSTSLVAVHMASELLRRHECDMCLAGGAQIRVPQRMGYMYQEGGFPSPDGYCRSFDAKSQGNVHGNGSGVLLLKRLADALEDGDHIYATIKGSAVVNDGALKVGYSAPGVDGQARAAAEALQVSGVDPESIGYLEASGTATELGDPLEIEALTQAWRLSTPKTGFCPIGSVKTNIGHLDVASGAAAMIKTALMLDNKKIPASLHFESPNPAIDFDSSPFYVNAELQDFPRGETPRRAAVHAYAVGGTNAHLIFEEAPEREPSGPSRPWQLLPLSARSSDALHRATEQLHQHFESLAEDTDGSLADAAYTLQVGRRGFRHRRVALCRHRGEAIEVLRDMPADRLRTGHLRDVESRVTFLLPGSPVDGLARELYDGEAVYRDAVDHGLTLVDPADRPAVEALFVDGVDGGDTAGGSAAALATVLHEYALAQLWRQWGVAPAAVLGCGLGEFSAACLSGALDLDGALALAAARGRMLRSGARIEVHRDAAEVTPQLSDGFHLEATLGAELCHVVGPEDGADALLDRLDDAGIDAFHLGTAPYVPVDTDDAWKRALVDAPWQAPAMPWLSSALGEWVTEPSAEALGVPVALHRALGHLADGDRPERRGPHLEVGGGDLLASTLRPMLDGADVLASLATRDALAEGDSPATAQLLSNLGRLWLAGVDIDWPGFSRHEQRHRCPLPTYPFERVRIWAEPSSEWGQLFQTPVDLDTKDTLDRWFYTPSWRRAPAAQAALDESAAMASDRPWLVLDASPDGDHPLAEALRSAGHGVIVLRPGDRLERLGDGTWTVPPGDGEAFHALITALREESLSPAGVVHLWSLGEHGGQASDQDSQAAQDDDELRYGFWSLLHLARALADRGGELPPLVVVTRGAEEVTGGEDLVPARATLNALLSTLPRELPGARCRQIDVEGAVGGRLASTLLREILADSGDTRIAYRGRHRWVADHERLDLGPEDGDAEASGTTPWTRLRSDGVHMITGGTGPMALVAARCLARHGGTRLALVGESALPPRDAWDAWLEEHGEDDATGHKITQLRQLEALDAELLLVDADMGRDGSVAKAMAQVRQHFGDLHSVIHAVGEPSAEDARPIAALDEDFFQYRLRQRLEPVLTVHRALHASPNGHTAPEFHLLSTTLGGILGAPLSVADNAADAYLVAFAKAADPAGPAWLCIDWDRLDDGSNPEGTGTAITIDEAEAVLARALTAPEEVLQVTVSTVDLGARRNALGQPPEEVEDIEQEIRPRPDLEGPFVAPQNDTEVAIAQLWAEILFLEQVGVTDNFFDLGGNSLMATQLVSRLREDFAIDLTLKDFFEEATVQRIAQGVELAQWASGPDGGTVSDGGELSDSGDTGEEEFGEI